ncbi:hypothetical protein C2G38_1626017 [Gigaspora rosea]|uniref:Protein kinase domain-containing protein n=1 Tax=Gigaspora rosea TaxID=44941 RepID=A0A397UX65_9GLOM|nr:hypothetical protein C2G38_1626017 [Gigaspora rosea]
MKADIYSFGIIMAEMSTGKPPFFDIEYDEILAIQICKGLRPEFAEGTPECYTQLALQCMDANPFKRPTASDIHDKLIRWHDIVNYSDAKNQNELAILRAFQSADETILTLLTEFPIYPKNKLASKLLNFKNLSERINTSSVELLNIYGSGNSISDDLYAIYSPLSEE